MTDAARTRRLRALPVSFFAGHAWVKKSDVAAVLDTEGDRQESAMRRSVVTDQPGHPVSARCCCWSFTPYWTSCGRCDCWQEDDDVYV